MRDASTPGSSPARTRIPAGAPADSPYALQLEKDFSGLKFEPVLEQEFRQVFQTESLPQIRRNLWIALVIITVDSWRARSRSRDEQAAESGEVTEPV